MSKWFKVELTSTQYIAMISNWGYDDVEFMASVSGRVKLRTYWIVDSEDGTPIKEMLPLDWARSVRDDLVTYVYKFKDETEAMAFKLRWS